MNKLKKSLFVFVLIIVFFTTICSLSYATLYGSIKNGLTLDQLKEYKGLIGFIIGFSLISNFFIGTIISVFKNDAAILNWWKDKVIE